MAIKKPYFQQVKMDIIDTRDGSKSIYLPEMDETYHSKFGARLESEYVFIQMGYRFIESKRLKILEIGLGTGLNVLLTILEQIKDKKSVYYESLEKYPLPPNTIKELNNFKNSTEKLFFKKIHKVAWNKAVEVKNDFILKKHQIDLHDFVTDKKFNLIYFDAFAPNKQPDLWTNIILKKMFNLLDKEGVLVTYSAKGSVRRTMQSVGFFVERLKGPPGKREMLRAIKKNL